MKFLKYKFSSKPDLANVEAFLTDKYFFYRRNYDGIWHCISEDLGNQEPISLDIIETFYMRCNKYFVKGDKLTIEF